MRTFLKIFTVIALILVFFACGKKKVVVSLEKEGVEILTCGTCLDFYGLKEKLAVGAVTNMYTIAEILQNAVSVVSP